jgi:oligopeptide/dipeptide ABC transporter ATP-binding protein
MTPTETQLRPAQTDNSQPLIEVNELTKYFPLRGGLFGRVKQYVKAVDGVSFTLNHGRTLGLVGESGCGKSTLGRAILYLQPPTSGQVRLEGQRIDKLDRAGLMAARRDMQIIFQDPYASLSPRRTVAQIVREPLDVQRIGTTAERRERVESLLNIVGMRQNALNRYPHEFSGGQRQRIGIARALALNPKFIVADEPVSALDVSVQSQVLNLIDKLKADRDISFLFISHDLAVIQHVSDDVAVMYLGKIVEQASAREIYANPQHPYTRALLSAIPVPDPARKAQRIVLEGDVPSPLNPPAGCPFHTRCPVAVSRCAAEVPEFKHHTGSANHQVACHLVD